MTVEYTNQWVRITDTLRPMIGLGISAFVAFVAFLPVSLLTGTTLIAFLSAAAAFVLTAFIALLIIRSRKVLTINLATRQVRFHVHTYAFSEIETVSASGQNVLLQAADGQLLSMPVFWVSKDNLRVIDRMLRMLDNEKVRTGALTIIQEQVEELSR